MNLKDRSRDELIRDIHDALDRGERAQAASEIRLHSLVENLPHGILVLDSDQRLIVANTTGLSCLVVLTEGAGVGDRIVALGGEPLQTFTTLGGDGLPPEVSSAGRDFAIQATVDDDSWSVVVREVTEEKRNQIRIQQHDRLAAVGQLAAGIAHDFNNMLTVMMGVAELMSLRPTTPDDIRKGLERIHGQGIKAAKLVQQILDYSRRSVARRGPTDMVPFLKESMKLLDETLPESISIVTETQADSFVVDGNLTQLQQVITNLALNARDAMPDGGTLKTTLGKVVVAPGEEPPSRWIGPGDWLCVEMSDTGEGMPQEVQAHVFEPFFTTKEAGKGTGLGLAQVYGIVKQHNGSIDVESTPGEGTTFVIYLPLLEVEAEVAPDHVAGVPQGNGELILVVEDDPNVLDLAEDMLISLNYKVLAALDGEAGVETYLTHRGEVDLVVSDVVMPKLDGYGLFDRVRASDPDVPVVLMTGYLTEDEKPPAGLAGFFEKPLTRPGLAHAVRLGLQANRRNV